MTRQPNKSFEIPAIAPLDQLRALFRSSRIGSGLDVETVASNASVSAETVRALEVNPRNVPLHELYGVSNVLNLDPGLVLELLHAAIR